ncbi:MAG: hypothetical protein N2439_07430, partial [Anaerolineae bacterium]|nr:hypothetical protein [Anaerolineae bacterium]
QMCIRDSICVAHEEPVVSEMPAQEATEHSILAAALSKPRHVPAAPDGGGQGMQFRQEALQ